MVELIRILASRFADLFRSRKLDRELKEELEFHIDMQTEKNLRKGMNPEDARRSARVTLGGFTQIQEECRNRRGFSFLGDTARDIRYGARLLFRNPLFALTAIMTLMLGIGANTAVFSIVNAAMPRPLPFDHSEELIIVAVYDSNFGMSVHHIVRTDFQALRRNSMNTVDVARYRTQQVNLSGKEGAERITIGEASDNFFSMLMVKTPIGRLLQSGDELPEADPVAVLSDGLWKRRFGADPDVLGHSVTLNGKIYSIVGILPADSMSQELNFDLWIPLPINEHGSPSTQAGPVYMLGRLKPGINIHAAQTELDRAYQEDFKSAPAGLFDALGQPHLVAVNWKSELSKETESSFFLFLGVTGTVLLVACANIANLLIARTIAREEEMLIRSAIGAGRIRIFRQFLTESLLIALIGGGLGLAVTFWARGLLITLVSENLTYISSIPIDWRVFGFTLLVSVITAIIAGVVPAWRAACSSPSLSINGGQRATVGKGLRAVFRLFVVAEIALVLALLVSSGLLLKTFMFLWQTDLGFQAKNILSISVDPARTRYADAPSREAYFERVLDRLQAIPGVEAVGITTVVPFGSYNTSISGISMNDSEETIPSNTSFRYAQISEDYFRTMNIPLLDGRFFSHFDRANASNVAIIDNLFARRYFAGESPVGRQIIFNKNTLTIIGVVGEIKYYQMREETRPHFYTLYTGRIININTPVNIVARASRNPMELAGLIRQALQSVDPDQPAFDVKTVDDMVLEPIKRQRTQSFVVCAFAVLALLLAFIGVYGVVSFSVNRRVREVGIRMTFGATRADIVKMILRETMIACMTGIILGTAVAVAVGRFLSGLLYGVTTTDPSIFAMAILFVAAIVFTAGFIPAYRAASAEPSDCLRHE